MSAHHHGTENAKQMSPSRPRHHLTRSITELSSPIKLHRHHHHLRGSHHPERDDRASQSAAPHLHLEMPRASLDLPRSEGITPYLTSAEQSRRTSAVPPGAEELATLAAAASAASKQQRLRDERERAAARTISLKKSLVTLDVFSNATTRRLDDTYYAVLEKLSVLQNTILAMKELASMSQETNDVFRTDSRGLVTEIESQIDGFGQFDEQQERIESLQGRIMTGREKARQLSERVDIVRGRIEGWERADMEWQEKTRKRLKVVWIITLVILSALVLLFLVAQYAPAVDVSRVKELGSRQTQGKAAVDEVLSRKTSVSETLRDEVRAALNRTRDEAHLDDETVLRAFDEL